MNFFCNSIYDSVTNVSSVGPLIGDNPWKPPTDGACHDDSCRCWNRLGLTELVVGCVITLTGILLCCALLVVNFWLRNNK